VRHRDDAGARIALRIAEGIELLEEHAGHADLLLEQAASGILERFIETNEATRDLGLTLERGLGPLHQEHPVERGKEVGQHAISG
jgi:hypothetical protein